MSGLHFQGGTLGATTLPPPPAERRPPRCQVPIHTIRRLFQLLGVWVCILFAVQGVRLWIDSATPNTTWLICHWIGEGALCVIAGLCGCYLEMRLFFPDIAKERALFALNRLGLAFGYIWVGCYSMGGHVQEGSEAWTTMGRITGILAWVVCVGDVSIACCSDHEEEEPPPPEDTEVGWSTEPKLEDVEFCKNCGTIRTVGHKYCPTCGNRLAADGGSAATFAGLPLSDKEKNNPFAQDAHAFADLTNTKKDPPSPARTSGPYSGALGHATSPGRPRHFEAFDPDTTETEAGLPAFGASPFAAHIRPASGGS